MYNIVTFTFVS